MARTTPTAGPSQEDEKGGRTPTERAERCVEWTSAQLQKLGNITGLTEEQIAEVEREILAQVTAAFQRLRAVNRGPFKFGAGAAGESGETGS